MLGRPAAGEGGGAGAAPPGVTVHHLHHDDEPVAPYNARGISSCPHVSLCFGLYLICMSCSVVGWYLLYRT